MKNIIITISFILSISLNSKGLVAQTNSTKPTICVLGGLPSTVKILEQIPDSLKSKYHFISFNRPGFGGSENQKLSNEKLIELAKEAGLQQNDFGIIGLSAGAPMALLLAEEFNLKHCGVISGMVTGESYLKYADSTITKQIMDLAMKPFSEFEQIMSGFPNIEGFVKEAGAKDKSTAIRAFYNELNFMISEELSSGLKDKTLSIEWYHGKNDKNVTLESVQHFLKEYENSSLTIIPDASHNLTFEDYLKKILAEWK